MLCSLQLFFHKFFTQKNSKVKAMAEKAARRKKGGDDDDDNMDDASDEEDLPRSVPKQDGTDDEDEEDNSDDEEDEVWKVRFPILTPPFDPSSVHRTDY